MDNKQIVGLYWARSETAISETAVKYGRYCHYIACRILNNDQDAEEVVNDTYLKTWNTIPPNRPDPLKPYVGAVTHEAKGAKNRDCTVEACHKGGLTARQIITIRFADGDVNEGDVVIAVLRPCEDLPYEWYWYAARHSVYPVGDEDKILRALG
ncbi:MAG: hypothetical protein MJ192_06520 [Clostridia bacterium]|nr:hypothetical protein [Clostridia bacterium]